MDLDGGVVGCLVRRGEHLGVGLPQGGSGLARTPQSLAVHRAVDEGGPQRVRQQDVVEAVPDAAGVEGARAWSGVEAWQVVAGAQRSGWV